MPQPTGSQSDTAERLDGSNESSSGFPGGSDGKDPPNKAGGAGSIPGSGRGPGGGTGNHSSMLAWEILGQRSLAGCSPRGHRESDMI